MSASGGDIVEITYTHPTLGSGVLRVKAAEDNAYHPGGLVTNSDANMIDGQGSPIWTKNRVRGYFTAVCVNDQNQGNELEKMIQLSAHPVAAEWVFSISNGVSYAGTGMPVGDLEGNINQSTFALRVEGGQFLKI